MSQYDEINDIDHFSDGDLAEPENLPEGKRVIGEVAAVSVARTDAENWVKFKQANQNGDTSAPAIDLSVRSLAFADGTPFPEDKNYMLQGDLTFFVGRNDRIGRNQLARLIKQTTGMSDDELRTKGLRAAVTEMKGAKLTYEIKLKKGEQMDFQRFTKIKAATADEVARIA